MQPRQSAHLPPPTADFVLAPGRAGRVENGMTLDELYETVGRRTGIPGRISMTQRKADQVPFRNRSPYGWWIATYLERFEYDDENKRNSGRRCLAWENTVLIRA